MATAANDSFERLYANNIGTVRTQKKNAFDPKRNSFPADPAMESVYKLIPGNHTSQAKDKQHRSKYADQARKEYANKKKTASMGPAKLILSQKSEFMKCGEGVAKVKDGICRKAAIPAEPGFMMPPSGKRFIEQNAIEMINSRPRNIKEAGRVYLDKIDYGRTPDYLERRIKQGEEDEINQLKDSKTELETRELREQGIAVLPNDERQQILVGLQENWDKLNYQYQRLSLTVDTAPKITRKLNMERQLKRFEDLIDKFSHTDIHVKIENS